MPSFSALSDILYILYAFLICKIDNKTFDSPPPNQQCRILKFRSCYGTWKILNMNFMLLEFQNHCSASYLRKNTQVSLLNWMTGSYVIVTVKYQSEHTWNCMRDNIVIAVPVCIALHVSRSSRAVSEGHFTVNTRYLHCSKRTVLQW